MPPNGAVSSTSTKPFLFIPCLVGCVTCKGQLTRRMRRDRSCRNILILVLQTHTLKLSQLVEWLTQLDVFSYLQKVANERLMSTISSIILFTLTCSGNFLNYNIFFSHVLSLCNRSEKIWKTGAVWIHLICYKPSFNKRSGGWRFILFTQ